MKKVSGNALLTKKRSEEHEANISANKKEIESCIKKKKMLEMICLQFLNQNYDLYLQHETMLD